RRIYCTVEYGLFGNDHPRAQCGILPGIQVAIESGEIAARYLQADTMRREKHIARRPHVDGVFVNFSGLDERSLLPDRVTIARAKNAILDIPSKPVGSNIHELDRPIGVLTGGRSVEFHADRAGNLDGLV